MRFAVDSKSALAVVLATVACARSGLSLDSDAVNGESEGGRAGTVSSGGAPLRGGAAGVSGGTGARMGGTGGVAPGTGGAPEGGTGGSPSSCRPRLAVGLPQLQTDGVPTDSEIVATIECSDGSPPRLDEFSMHLTLDDHEIEGAVRVVAPDRLVFEPVRRMGLGTTYSVDVNRADWSDGWYFETRDGKWGEPELVGEGTPGDLALNHAGAGAVLFVMRTGDHSIVQVRRFSGEHLDAGESEILRDDDPVNVSGSVLATDEAGRLLAAWTEYRGDYTAWVRQGEADGSWTDLRQLTEGDQGGMASAWLQDAALRADGRGFLLWKERERLIGGDLYAGRMLTVRVADRMNTDDARVAVEPGGSLWVVYGAYPQVFAYRRDASGHWGEPQVLAESSAIQPAVALDANGSGLAGWAYGEAIARTLGPDQTLGPAAPLDTAGERGENSGNTLRLAVDRFGNGHALWVNVSHFVISDTGSGMWFGNVPEVRTQRYLFGRGWDLGHATLDPPAPAAATGGYRTVSRRALVLDEQGNGFAGWGQTDPPGESETRVARFNTHGWNASSQLAADGNAPLVAVDARGRALAVWGSGGEVYVARFLEPD